MQTHRIVLMEILYSSTAVLYKGVYAKCFLKNAMVRCQASFAAMSL